jgi:hypothetical protein
MIRSSILPSRLRPKPQRLQVNGLQVNGRDFELCKSRYRLNPNTRWPVGPGLPPAGSMVTPKAL